MGMFVGIAISGSEAAISSKSDSDSKRARKPTNRKGSLSTRAIRSIGFVVVDVFIGVICVRSFMSQSAGLLTCATDILVLACRVDASAMRSEEHTSELQSLTNLVCR